MKYEKEFRKSHPETIGEKDKEFDLYNYAEFLESQLQQKDKEIEELRLLIEIVDTELADLEDYTKGIPGEMITNLRHRINFLTNPERE